MVHQELQRVGRWSALFVAGRKFLLSPQGACRVCAAASLCSAGRAAAKLAYARCSSRACSSTVEQGTHNPLVVGSNPAGPTTQFRQNTWSNAVFMISRFVRPACRIRWKTVEFARVVARCCIPTPFGYVRCQPVGYRRQRAPRDLLVVLLLRRAARVPHSTAGVDAARGVLSVLWRRTKSVCRQRLSDRRQARGARDLTSQWVVVLTGGRCRTARSRVRRARRASLQPRVCYATSCRRLRGSRGSGTSWTRC